MDTITKKRAKCLMLFTYEVQCINTNIKTLLRDLHAADVRYDLDSWLVVTVYYRSDLVQL